MFGSKSMRISVFDICSRSFKLIRGDWMLIVPYFLFFLAVHVFGLLSGQAENVSVEDVAKTTGSLFIQVVLIGWLAEIIFKVFTLIMGVTLLNKKDVNIGDVIGKSLGVLSRVVLGTGCFVLPVFFFLTLLMTEPTSVSFMDTFIKISLFLGVIFLSIIVQFVPVIIIVNKDQVLQA